MKKLTKKQKTLIAAGITFVMIAVVIYVIVTVETSGAPVNIMW